MAAPKAQKDELRRQRARRLKFAREAAGFAGPQEVADATEWNYNTYKSHENGIRAYTYEDAERFVRRFKADAKGLTLEWLWTGDGAAPISPKSLRNIKKSENVPKDSAAGVTHDGHHPITEGEKPDLAGGEMSPLSLQRLANFLELFLTSGGLAAGEAFIKAAIELAIKQQIAKRGEETTEHFQRRRRTAATVT